MLCVRPGCDRQLCSSRFSPKIPAGSLLVTHLLLHPEPLLPLRGVLLQWLRELPPLRLKLVTPHPKIEYHNVKTKKKRWRDRGAGGRRRGGGVNGQRTEIYTKKRPRGTKKKKQNLHSFFFGIDKGHKTMHHCGFCLMSTAPKHVDSAWEASRQSDSVNSRVTPRALRQYIRAQHEDSTPTA